MKSRILKGNKILSTSRFHGSVIKMHIWTKCININHMDTEWTLKHLKHSCGAEILFHYVGLCTGFGWGKADFIHSALCTAVVWICVEDMAEKRFYLLLSNAYTSQGLFLHHSTPRRLGEHKELEARHNLYSWSPRSTGYPTPYGIMLTNKSWGRDKEAGGMLRVWPLSPLPVLEPCFPGDSWTPLCPQVGKQWIN